MKKKERSELKTFVKVLWIISAILLILGGVIFFYNPLPAFIFTEYVVGGVLVLSGILNIIAYIRTHKVMLGGGWILAEGVLSLVLGALIFFSKYNEALFAITLSVSLGVWLLVSGISNFSRSVDLHKLGAKGWGWLTFWGIICIIAAVAFFCHPVAAAVGSVGWMTGFVMILGGISALVKCLARDIED